MCQAGDFLNRKAFWVTVKISIICALLIAAVLLFGRAGQSLEPYKEAVGKPDPYPVIVLDAGHGGEDGGAVGVNGVVEKNLNLDIALVLKELLELSGVRCVMTRCEDVMLYDQSIPGKKKTQDLKNRVSIAEQNPDSLVISIHMNSYPISKYSGAQVYYSPNNPKSQLLAQQVMQAVTRQLQPENKRELKQADSAIYLLDKINNPCILVECGFISNPKEAELLSTPEYRRRIALTLYSAIIEYLYKEV